MSAFDRAALLLIDWQEGMHDPKWGRSNNPDAERNAERLLAAWRRSGRPIYHVQHLSKEPDSVFQPERPGSALMPFARPRSGEPLFQKDVNSAFIGTDLERRLRSAGITTLVLTGMQSDHCVSSTARMADDRGFTTNNLASLNGEFATIVSTAQVLDARPACPEPTSTA